MTKGKSSKSETKKLLRGSEDSSIQRKNVDFGTYHHSTPKESDEIRNRAEGSFLKLLQPLYPAGASLRILDAGCGLGFLMWVAAKCFPKAHITGVDLFKHESISGMSMDAAVKNMKSLGISSRTSFLKYDLTKPIEFDVPYDLVLSNLVFHNMGKKRLNAYATVFDALKPGGFFVIGDVFPHDKTDLEYFRKCSTLIQEVDEGGTGPWKYKIRVLKNHSPDK
ncbi:MAG TPA: class I SAM-dependent methyltransferase [Alloacidobacterium sp.]|jgi:SAM-dependent methyltransferase|nr:class I SAM-dependent methyltransferase [Alloacidobacterium sp.]